MAVADDRLQQALAAIDTANSDDPHQIEVRGELRPKELAHAELASQWIEHLIDAPSDELQLAARAHHLRRWSLDRSEYPEGRKGYLTWRHALMDLHANECARILAQHGYPEDTIERVGHIIHRRNMKADRESQALEDALCLIFFETQLEDLAGRVEPEKMRDIGIKTLAKMSPDAHQIALELPIPEAHVALLRELLEAL